jgi:CxxC motif-containing protein (DUF1111 family)
LSARGGRSDGRTADEFHPGFRTSRSVVLHRFGVDPVYKAWRVGDIDSIYSDLLLHDMGPALSDSGGYYGISEPKSTTNGVKSQEWRTPPLWGFRDSGPYLHDGRAENLEEAVALHGGEATNSAKRFFKLLPAERLRVQAFLRSLAPRGVAAR